MADQRYTKQLSHHSLPFYWVIISPKKQMQQLDNLAILHFDNHRYKQDFNRVCRESLNTFPCFWRYSALRNTELEVSRLVNDLEVSSGDGRLQKQGWFELRSGHKWTHCSRVYATTSKLSHQLMFSSSILPNFFSLTQCKSWSGLHLRNTYIRKTKTHKHYWIYSTPWWNISLS